MLLTVEDLIGIISSFRTSHNYYSLQTELGGVAGCDFMIQDFDEVKLLECIKELIRVDREWVPRLTTVPSIYDQPLLERRYVKACRPFTKFIIEITIGMH